MSRSDMSMSVMEAIYQRRSVRSFETTRLDRESIHSLLAAAVRAPTAIHEEQWAFAVVQGQKAIKAISEQICGTDDVSPVPTASVKVAPIRILSREPEVNLFHDADTLILVCAQPMGPYVTADCWLAAENLMLAAHAMGLGTCVVGSAVTGLNKSAIKRELGIAEEINIVVPIVVGVPKDSAEPGKRAEPQVLSWMAADDE